ncbi:hypothetical protein E4P82_01860, partial [Candidatus Competibacter phosphatis]|nr:hypothetical protein [Candidatus Competibacter phosphatis]
QKKSGRMVVIEVKSLFNGSRNSSTAFLKLLKKKKTDKGFQVLPRRWVVERTFAWLGRSRRLSKDYERKPTSSTGHVYMASIRLMLRRICKERVLLQGTALEVA